MRIVAVRRCAFLYFAMSYPLGILSKRLEKRLEGRSAAEAAEADASTDGATS